jgi:branched-chain amino acid transport system ATP-binding protein
MTIALDVSDRIDVVGHGRIVFSGSPAELKANHDVQQRWLKVSESTVGQFDCGRDNV